MFGESVDEREQNECEKKLNERRRRCRRRQKVIDEYCFDTLTIAHKYTVIIFGRIIFLFTHIHSLSPVKSKVRTFNWGE